MNHIDSIAIEQRARKMRAEEIRRITGLLTQKLGTVGRLLIVSMCGAAATMVKSARAILSGHPMAGHH